MPQGVLKMKICATITTVPYPKNQYFKGVFMAEYSYLKLCEACRKIWENHEEEILRRLEEKFEQRQLEFEFSQKAAQASREEMQQTLDL